MTAYPTIKFFPSGSNTPQDYERGRAEQAFVDFLNEKCGTHRTVGGGLNDKAGTIKSLNDIVAKYVSGENWSKVAKELEKGAANLKDKYADYYVKTVNKLHENADYVSKEIARLEKMIGKGSLAPEKLDDLVSRMNILRQFVGKEEEAKEKKEEL